MNNTQCNPTEEKFYLRDDGTYVCKTGNFYRAYRADGTEIKEVLISLNICIMSLRGMLEGAVNIHSCRESIEIEPGLRALLEA